MGRSESLQEFDKRIMSAIVQEAQQTQLLFEYGVITADVVLKWADSMIIQLQIPPDTLIELSTTSPSKTENIITCLHRVSSGADFWSAFRGALPQIRDYVSTHRECAESIANHFFLTACSDVSNVPKDLNFIYGFDDAFFLANHGTFGDFETIYREFIGELDKACGVNPVR